MNARELLDQHHEQIEKVIRHHAGRLLRTGLFADKDYGDLVQDLWLDLLQRANEYDAERCAFTSFASRIIAWQAFKQLKETLTRKPRPKTVSLYDTVPDGRDEITRIETIPADTAARVQGRSGRPEAQARELACDVRYVISLLPPDLQDLCMWMALYPSTASLKKACSRSHDYLNPRLRKIREHFKFYGMDEYLEG